MNKITDSQYRLIIEKCDGSSLDAIWEMFNPIHRGWTNFPLEMVESFSRRRKLFLEVLERLLGEGFVKLHKNGIFLSNDFKEQVKNFGLNFPISEEEIDNLCTSPGNEPPYKGFGMNVWWFLDICPAGVAWRTLDGSYQIAD